MALKSKEKKVYFQELIEMIIDSHCHLSDQKFRDDIEDVVKRAEQAGIVKMIVPGTDLKDCVRVGRLLNEYPNLYGVAGIYPGNAEEVKDTKAAIEELKEIIERNKKFIGIGEIGLDGYWNQRDVDRQKEVFRAQLELGLDLDLPTVIHSRQAGIEIKEVFEEMEKLPRGQFHCFGEDEEFLEYVLDKGFYVSFCGNITYKSAGNLRELFKKTPLNRILLETDAPYLPPEPLRGSRNEPRNVKIIGEFMAKVAGISFEELTTISYKNSLQLFKLD